MKKILIAVDMQNDFINGALGSNEAEKIVPLVAEKIKSFDGDIIITYDTHTDDYMNTQEGRKLPVPHCIKGTFGWELNSSIQESLKDKQYSIIEKPVFGSYALVDKVRETIGDNEENASIELIGLCTDICVVSNALLLKNAFLETEITVNSACCAGVTPQKHEAALETMRSCQINVI